MVQAAKVGITAVALLGILVAACTSAAAPYILVGYAAFGFSIGWMARRKVGGRR